MAHNYQPTCEDDPDQDQGDKATLVSTASPPGKSTAKKNTGSAASDSGYSSLSKTSNSSKASTGKTLRPARTPAANSSADVGTQKAPPSSHKPSKTPLRSQSKARSSSSSCPYPDCANCKTMRHLSQPPVSKETPSGLWVQRPAQPPPQAPPTYPQSYAAAPVLAPAAPLNGPPPPAVPRQSSRSQSMSQARPMSIAIPGAYIFPAPAPVQRPPSTYIPTAGPLQPPPPAPPPPPPPQRTPSATVPQPPQGTWVRKSKAPYPPPPLQRPSISHRATDATTTTRPTSMYGPPAIFHHEASPSGQYYESRAHSEMLPPLRPETQGYSSGYPSRRLSNDVQSRRQSVNWGKPAYIVEDPDRTIRASQSNARPTILNHPYGKSRSATYDRGTGARYTGGMVTVERTTNAPMRRAEKIYNYTQRAQSYQDEADDRARDGTDSLANEMSLFDLDSTTSPSSPQRHRPSKSSHGRSASRVSHAASSVSRMSTETGTIRIKMVDNAVEISGSTEGHNMNFTRGEDGKPIVTLGNGSPTKTRESRYYGEGSVRSNASFAERMGRRPGSGGSGDWAVEGSPSVSRTTSRRESTTGRRESRSHR